MQPDFFCPPNHDVASPEIVGWMRTVGNLRKTRHRVEDRVGWVFTLTAADAFVMAAII